MNVAPDTNAYSDPDVRSRRVPGTLVYADCSFDELR